MNWDEIIINLLKFNLNDFAECYWITGNSVLFILLAVCLGCLVLVVLVVFMFIFIFIL